MLTLYFNKDNLNAHKYNFLFHNSCWRKKVKNQDILYSANVQMSAYNYSCRWIVVPKLGKNKTKRGYGSCFNSSSKGHWLMNPVLAISTCLVFFLNETCLKHSWKSHCAIGGRPQASTWWHIQLSRNELSFLLAKKWKWMSNSSHIFRHNSRKRLSHANYFF